MGPEGCAESARVTGSVGLAEEELPAGSLGRTAFVTWVGSRRQRSAARLLIESIRAFGGPMGTLPILVMESDNEDAPCDTLRGEGVHIHRLVLPEEVRGYLFADKVYAGAMAEGLLGDGFRTLVSLSPDCLVVNPPMLFTLPSSVDVAVRPVHIRNIGSPSSGPVDSFWRGIYDALGVEDVPFTVESFVDVESVRAYFNSAAYSLNPSIGLLRRWRDVFTSLVCDEDFQRESCGDDLHKIFLHQAVLSSLIASRLARSRIRMLPPEYGYPYNLHGSVRKSRKAHSMNSLVCIIYEERPVDPRVVSDIEVLEPLRSWLMAHAGSCIPR
jgi:hypothetical protein